MSVLSGDREEQNDALDLLHARFLLRIRDEQPLPARRDRTSVFLQRLVSLRRPRPQVGDAALLVANFLEDVADFGGEVVEGADKVCEKDGGVFGGHRRVSVRLLELYGVIRGEL